MTMGFPDGFAASAPLPTCVPTMPAASSDTATAGNSRLFRITIPPSRRPSRRVDQRAVQLRAPVSKDRQVHPLIAERAIRERPAHLLLSPSRCLGNDLAVAGDDDAPARTSSVRRRTRIAPEDVDEV